MEPVLGDPGMLIALSLKGLLEWQSKREETPPPHTHTSFACVAMEKVRMEQ